MAPEILSPTSGACVGFSLEEERVMQQSRDKYFHQLENQGINYFRRQCTNHQIPAQTIKQLAPNAIKGLSIPSQLLAKLRSNKDR